MLPFPSLDGSDEEPPCWFYDASLLFRRMALNNVDPAELAENDPLLFYELQGLCTLCPSKERCVIDLANVAGDDSEWREYCPNARAFAALEMHQNCCGLAAQHGANHESTFVTELGRVIPASGERQIEEMLSENPMA